jgi:hypothetical protein
MGRLVYNILFCAYAVSALANFIFLCVITHNADNQHYHRINQWDLIYHAHNLGAHICSAVTIWNMWMPKSFARSPWLSCLHFVGTEIVKLYFSGKWVTYWPNKNSTQWLTYTIAGYNVTDWKGDQDAKKVSTFKYYTQKFNISWSPNPISPQLSPTWVSPKEPFYQWVNKRTYNLIKPLLALAGITTGLGLLVCGYAYYDFWITKQSKAAKKDDAPASPKGLSEVPLVS